MNYLIFKGIDSRSVGGLLVSELPPVAKPPMRIIETEIDGVDGSIIEELGYGAYDREVNIGVKRGTNIDDIVSYFTGAGDIVFSNEPDKLYSGCIVNQIDFERLLRFKTATVIFRVQPFKHKFNETPINALLVDAYKRFDFKEKWAQRSEQIGVNSGSIEIDSTSIRMLNPADTNQRTNGTTHTSVVPTGAQQGLIYNLGFDDIGNETNDRIILLSCSDKCKIRLFKYGAGCDYIEYQDFVISQAGNHSLNFTVNYNVEFFFSLMIINTSGTDLTIDELAVYDVPATAPSSVTVVNEGTAPAEPIIELEGSGTVTLGVNGRTMLTYQFPTGESKVILDSAKQDAYYGSQLKNRSMTGDFLKLEKGENELMFDSSGGSITKLEVKRYNRWV